MFNNPIVVLMFTAIHDYACISVACVSCQEEYMFGVSESGYNAWLEGKEVNKAFPELSAASRELFISGVYGVCWDTMMAEGEE